MNNETITKVAETATQKSEKVISGPLFLLFAEFLGYTSPIVEWAEKICKGEKVDNFKRKIVNIDAIGVFNQIKKDNFTTEEIKGWFYELYDLLLKRYDKPDIQPSDELPF